MRKAYGVEEELVLLGSTPKKGQSPSDGMLRGPGISIRNRRKNFRCIQWCKQLLYKASCLQRCLRTGSHFIEEDSSFVHY
jgi:hypothetical protein